MLERESEEGFGSSDAWNCADFVDDLRFEVFEGSLFENGGKVPSAENPADVFDAGDFFEVCFNGFQDVEMLFWQDLD